MGGIQVCLPQSFPKIVDGDYLEGGLTGKLMTKDVALYVDRVRELGVVSLNASGPLASFGLGTALGYGDMINNRVVDGHRRMCPAASACTPEPNQERKEEQMQVFHGRMEGAPSELRSSTFTGTVWADPIMPSTANVMINNVFFAPGARTHWHSHGQGQVLHVTSGSGWVCLEGSAPQRIRAGDVVWIGANERHWHGAGADSYMVHMATSLGKTLWQEPVADAAYAADA